jgi:YVTN family beta-propeller protein
MSHNAAISSTNWARPTKLRYALSALMRPFACRLLLLLPLVLAAAAVALACSKNDDAGARDAASDVVATRIETVAEGGLADAAAPALDAGKDAGRVLAEIPEIEPDASGPPPMLEVQEVEAVFAQPKGAFLSHDETTLYVTNFRESGKHSVSVLDADTLAPRGELVVPGSAVEAAVSADDKTLFVSDFWRHALFFMDVEKGTILHEVKVGVHPKIVVLSPDDRFVFVANWSSDDVTQIDVKSATVVRTLKAGKRPRGMAVTRAGALYVANFFGDSIDVWEGESLEKHHLVKTCKCPRHLALSPDEKTLYISCLTASQVQAMDLSTEKVVHHAQVGDAPKSIGISASGRYVWSADYGLTRSISVVDTTDFTSRTFPVPGMDRGSGVAVARDGKHAYVTGWYDSHVYKVGFVGSGGHPEQAAKKLSKWRYRAFSPDPGDGP